ASGTPRDEVTSNTTRCFPGILSNHSSCGWRAGWNGVAAVCALAGRPPKAKAAAKALIPDINDRRAHILFVIGLLCIAQDSTRGPDHFRKIKSAGDYAESARASSETILNRADTLRNASTTAGSKCVPRPFMISPTVSSCDRQRWYSVRARTAS